MFGLGRATTALWPAGFERVLLRDIVMAMPEENLMDSDILERHGTCTSYCAVLQEQRLVAE